jgi:hypothetical protein
VLDFIPRETGIPTVSDPSRGGFNLHYRNGAMLSGHGCKIVKTQRIAAGPPVVDSRGAETVSAPAERRTVPILSPSPAYTMDEFEELHERHDRTRRTSKTVTVDRLGHDTISSWIVSEALRRAKQVDVAELR